MVGLEIPNLHLETIVFKDQNGYHSQSGAYITYAHHIMFSRSELDLDMLIFWTQCRYDSI